MTSPFEPTDQQLRREWMGKGADPVMPKAVMPRGPSIASAIIGAMIAGATIGVLLGAFSILIG